MIKKFQLRNGMKVLLQPSHRSPVVSIQVWVKTGSADEQAGQEGLTHFIEHLLFKGTEKFKTAEIAKLVEGSGGELNAYTSFDQTVYYITISSKYVGLAAEALGEMLGAPLFDPKEIDNEREVVIEEIKRSNDSPGRVSGNLLFSTVYSKHSYGRPVIGYPEVVSTASPEKIKKLFHSRYSPENVFIVVAGDFEQDEMKRTIEQNFLKVKGKKKSVKRVVEPKQEGARVSVREGNYNEMYLNLAWRTDPSLLKKIAEMDVLSIILGAGDSSRLFHKLRLENHLVNSIGASLFYSLDPGFLAISATMKTDNLEAALNEVAEILIELKLTAPKQEEIQSATVNLEASEIYGLESVDNLAGKMGRYQHLFNDAEYFKKYLAKIKKINALEISKITKQLFGTNNLTITALVPNKTEGAETKIREWVKCFEMANQFCGLNKIELPQKDKSKKTNPKLQTKKTDQFFKKETQSGSKIIFKTSKETDVVSVQIGFLGGLRAEPKELIGISELMAGTWLSGTKTRAEKELVEFIESRASSIRPYAGRNSFGIAVDTLKDFEVDMAMLLEEVLVSPAFNETVVEREKQVQQENLKTQQDRPSQLVYCDFMEKLFGDHPYSKNPIGTSESIKNINRQNIVNFMTGLKNKSNVTAVVAGAADVNLWDKTIQQALRAFPEGRAFQKNIVEAEVVAAGTTFRELKKEQSHLIYGFKGLKITDPERHVLQVIQSILSGQGGRLFYNLREKASLAYSVSPIRMDWIESGCFGVYIGCSPEKSAKAIEMIQHEFEHLIQNRVSDSELERSKKYLIGRHDIGLQRTAAVASSLMFNEIYGIEGEEVFKFADTIYAVSSDDILELSQKLFSRPHIVSAVGPINPFNAT